jgi:hypothetical protein
VRVEDFSKMRTMARERRSSVVAELKLVFFNSLARWTTAVSSAGVRSLRVRKSRLMDGTSQMRGHKKEKRPFGALVKSLALRQLPRKVFKVR